MGKVRTTLTIDSDVLKAVRVKAARTGVRDSQVIESAIRRDLGLDLLEAIWARNELPDNDAMELALEAQEAVRRNGA